MEVSAYKLVLAISLMINVLMIVPENVTAPMITAVNGTAIVIQWTEPEVPNGEIVEYSIFL